MDGDWQAQQQLTAQVASLRLLSEDAGYAGTGQGEVLRLENGTWLGDWAEPSRTGGFPLELWGIAVLNGAAGDPTIVVAGGCETLLVRSPEQPALYGVYLPLAMADRGVPLPPRLTAARRNR